MLVLRPPAKRKLKIALLCLVSLLVLYYFGVFYHPFERDFYTDFHYPYDGDLEPLVMQLKHNQTPTIPKINDYNFYYYKSCATKCKDVAELRLVYIVKSAPKNFERRSAIRSSWGFQRRFSDVEIRTVFLVGLHQNDAQMQVSLNQESQQFNDIVQANYTDSYFNNTLKTMSGFEWAVKYCPNARFYVFIDDDYYISTKNILRFIRFPTNYPQYLTEHLGNLNDMILHRKPMKEENFDLDEDVRLYAGYGFHSAPHRHHLSKWYVSLEDYPYHLWPPYISGGTYVLSNAALKDMYYAHFYTKHFRFDDIYVGILAFKTKIEPFHCEYFHFNKQPYSNFTFKYVIASHGYGNPNEMVRVWNQQKSLGNA